MAASTSLRLREDLKDRVYTRAARERVTVTALVERLLSEGIDQLDHPGIVFRGRTNDRRAGLAGGPDVWEIVARLRELDGPTEERIETLSAEIDLHPRLIRIAVEYAADNADEIRAQIDANEAAIARSQRAAEQREALLA